MNGLKICVEPADSADAAWCLAQYFRELATAFDQGYDPKLAQPFALDDTQPPSGCLVVARLDGRPVGCGALKRVDGTTGEIKRVWTAPAARGQGVARAIMATLEQRARDAGYTRLRLDTNAKLAAAQAMYRKLGYHEVARFNDDPYPTHFFAREL